MAFGDGDIDVFFQDGDVARFPDSSIVPGFLDFPEEIDLMGGQLKAGGAVNQRATFTCSAAFYDKFDAAGRGATVVINGSTMTIKDWHRENDGRTMLVKVGGDGLLQQIPLRPPGGR